MATAQETWVAEFQTKNPDVTVNYSPDGSGAGREAFAGGGVDFAGSDRAMEPGRGDRRSAGQLPLRRQSRRNQPAGLHQPDRGHLQRRGRHRPQARRRHAGQHLRGQDHQVERHQDHRRSTRGVSCPTRTSPPCTARTTPAPRRTSPTTCTRPPRRCGPTSRTASGRFQGGEAAPQTSGVVDAVDQRHRHHRLRRRLQGRRPGRGPDQGRRQVRHVLDRRPRPRSSTRPSGSPATVARRTTGRSS